MIFVFNYSILKIESSTSPFSAYSFFSWVRKLVDVLQQFLALVSTQPENTVSGHIQTSQESYRPKTLCDYNYCRRFRAAL